MFNLDKGLVASALVAICLAAQAHGLVTNDASSELRGKSYIVERDGIDHHVFEHGATGSKIDFVKNSGICETTPGVNQYSGYFSVGSRIISNILSSLGSLKYSKHEHVVLVL